MSIHPKRGTYSTGQNIHLRCHSNLTLNHKKNVKSLGDFKKLSDLIKWYKDDKEFSGENMFIQIQTKLLNENMLNSELTIHNANFKDSGVYKCIYDEFHEKSIVTVNNKSKRHLKL